MSKIHDFSIMSATEAYAASQSGIVADGDIMTLSNGAKAVMVQAWPVLVCGECEGFHRLDEGITWKDFENGRYADAAKKAIIDTRDSTIKLTLNGETREVVASDWGDYWMAYGIELVTQHGSKKHSGYISLRKGKDCYLLNDIISYGYHGMRGNGSGSPSQIRWIGFSDTTMDDLGDLDAWEPVSEEEQEAIIAAECKAIRDRAAA